MSAALDINLFTKYFNSCPVIHGTLPQYPVNFSAISCFAVSFQKIQRA